MRVIFIYFNHNVYLLEVKDYSYFKIKKNTVTVLSMTTDCRLYKDSLMRYVYTNVLCFSFIFPAYEPWLVWVDMREESHSQEQSAVSAAQSQESERTKASKACCFCWCCCCSCSWWATHLSISRQWKSRRDLKSNLVERHINLNAMLPNWMLFITERQ